MPGERTKECKLPGERRGMQGNARGMYESGGKVPGECRGMQRNTGKCQGNV